VQALEAHTLGEVGNLGTVSLRVSSGTIVPIFIEIGSYLTDKEQKISWHSFFWDTVYFRFGGDHKSRHFGCAARIAQNPLHTFPP